MTARVINIPNATASATRTNINDALAALGSTNSGATEPPGSLNNMLWYDTANHILKLKAEVGSDWISIGYFDQSTDTFRIFDDTQLVDASGTATDGVLGDQSTATWEAGTGTTESLVSPAKVKASVINNIPNTLGVGQTWQNMSASRVVGTSYQNSTGRPIMVSVCTRSTIRYDFQVSINNSTWISVGAVAGFGNLGDEKSSQVIVPDTHYYRVTGGTLKMWAELR